MNAQTFTKSTALTYACENGHTEVADLLVNHGADLVSCATTFLSNLLIERLIYYLNVAGLTCVHCISTWMTEDVYNS